jgi:hypothetical protein
VQQHRSFDLAVLIRWPHSTRRIQEVDLDKTRTAGLQVLWPEKARAIALRIHVSAPECVIHDADTHSFRLCRGQDSPVFYFQLTPQQTGRIGIIVTIYQEQDWLGGTRLHTLAQAQVAGKVAMQTYSRSFEIAHAAQVAVAKHIALLFSPTELRNLCFTLNVPYNDLPRETHSELARELVTYAVRHGRFVELVQTCQARRPFVQWDALANILPAS